MNIDELFMKPAFQNIEPERLELFREYLTRLEGQNVMASLPILSEFSKKMSDGRPLSRAEQEAILTALIENMSPSEKRQAEMIFSVLKL